jgi:hypothetical protein
MLSDRSGRYAVTGLGGNGQATLPESGHRPALLLRRLRLIESINRRHMTEGSCPVGFRAGSRRELSQTYQNRISIKVSDPETSQNAVGIGANSVTNFFP